MHPNSTHYRRYPKHFINSIFDLLFDPSLFQKNNPSNQLESPSDKKLPTCQEASKLSPVHTHRRYPVMESEISKVTQKIASLTRPPSADDLSKASQHLKSLQGGVITAINSTRRYTVDADHGTAFHCCIRTVTC